MISFNNKKIWRQPLSLKTQCALIGRCQRHELAPTTILYLLLWHLKFNKVCHWTQMQYMPTSAGWVINILCSFFWKWQTLKSTWIKYLRNYFVVITGSDTDVRYTTVKTSYFTAWRQLDMQKKTKKQMDVCAYVLLGLLLLVLIFQAEI